MAKTPCCDDCTETGTNCADGDINCWDKVLTMIEDIKELEKDRHNTLMEKGRAVRDAIEEFLNGDKD